MISGLVCVCVSLSLTDDNIACVWRWRETRRENNKNVSYTYIKKLVFVCVSFFPIWNNNCFFFIWNKFLYYIISLSSLMLSWDNFTLVVFVGHRRKRPKIGLDKRSETDRGCPTMKNDDLIENGLENKANNKMLHINTLFRNCGWCILDLYTILLTPPPPENFYKSLE